MVRFSSSAAALGCLLALGACGLDGTLKKPSEMTAAERCANAEMALALMEANGVGPQTLARARANVDIICVPEPVVAPADAS